MFCQKCGKNLSNDAQFCSGCGGSIATPASSPTQPVHSPQKKKKRFGCLSALIVIVILFIAVLIATGGSFDFSFSTAKFKQTVSTSAVDQKTAEPIAPADTFYSNEPVIYVSGLITGAVKGTKVKSVWINKDTGLTLVNPESEIDYNGWISFPYFNPQGGFQTGQYEVTLYINDKEQSKINFEILPSIGLSNDFVLNSIDIYSSQNAGDTPSLNQGIIYADTYEIIIELDISNAKAGPLTVHWIWEDENHLITSYSADIPDGDSGPFFALSRPDNGWPIGSYRADFEYDGDIFVSAYFKAAASFVKRIDTMISQNKEDAILSDTNVISQNTWEIMFSLSIDSPKSGTLFSEWYWMDDDYLIINYNVDIPAGESNPWVSLTRPDNGWPVGEYRVDLIFDNELIARVTFYVSEEDISLSDPSSDDTNTSYNEIFEALVGIGDIDALDVNYDFIPIPGGNLEYAYKQDANIHGTPSDNKKTAVFGVYTSSSLKEVYKWAQNKFTNDGWTINQEHLRDDGSFNIIAVYDPAGDYKDMTWLMFLCDDYSAKNATEISIVFDIE